MWSSIGLAYIGSVDQDSCIIEHRRKPYDDQKSYGMENVSRVFERLALAWPVKGNSFERPRSTRHILIAGGSV